MKYFLNHLLLHNTPHMRTSRFPHLSYILYLVALTLVLLPVCTHAGVVKLKGRVVAPLGDTVEVSFNDNNLAYYPKKYPARLDKKGNFSVSFPVPDGVYTIVQLAHGNRLADIIVAAGDSLVVTVNGRRFDSTIHYAGRGSSIQNFLAAYTIQKGRINQYPARVKSALQKEPKDFLKAIDDEYDMEAAMLKKAADPLPASFAAYWKNFHKYYNYFFIQQYPQTHQIIKLRRYTDTIPAENYEVVKAMPLAFADSLLQIPSYLLYLTGALEIKLKADGFTWLGRDSTRSIAFEDSVYRMTYKTMPDKSAEYNIAQNIYGRAKSQRLSRTEAQLAAFRQRWLTSTYSTFIDKQVAIARRLAPGQPAPDFDIRTEDGGHMKLSDLRGKVVYLTFWAGWCRQCVGEMMSGHMVKDLIIKKPLQFVYASIGTDTAGERTVTDRYHIDGLFTNFDGMWNAPEVQAYGVQGLPAYYLIDEDGNFALQHTPSPGQTTELVVEIGKLFK